MLEIMSRAIQRSDEVFSILVNEFLSDPDEVFAVWEVNYAHILKYISTVWFNQFKIRVVRKIAFFRIFSAQSFDCELQMKLTKSDVTLNERDSLQDMLESEKQLMGIYNTHGNI